MSEKEIPVQDPASLLSDAASEWCPDAETSAFAEISPAISPLNPEGGNDYVAFIDDPFGIKTIEIAEAQQIADELDLNDADEFEELDDSTLEHLARAMEQETAKIETAAREAQAQTAEEQAVELAAQIAEDQALSALMAQEQAEAEKALELDPELLAALPQEPQVDVDGNLDLSELQSCIETLLFMMDKPVSAKKLQEWLGPTFQQELFENALQALQARYSSPSHGIELVEVGQGWQLRTKPGRAALAKKLARVQTQRLSSGGMETLAIIAYRQPVLKEEIDKIRGVDSSYFVRGLLDRKLIAISGRSELPGRPMLYSTADHFLELFGLKDLTSMPPLRELEQMVPQSQSKNPEDEDPRVKEMRRLVGQMKADTSTSLLYDPREDEIILQEIRERVKAIPTSTPYLEEQKTLEKAAKEQAARIASGEIAPLDIPTELATEQS
ncbi:SMC-Scp complex subunit ScpB [Bdellovibrionota bacterium FG-1]